MPCALAIAITSVRDPSAQRSLLDRRVAARGIEAIADEIEALLEATRSGYPEARRATLGLSSWLVHHHALSAPSSALVPSRAPLSPSSTLVALRASTERERRPLLATLLLDGVAASTLAKGGRLGEICLPQSAIDSAPPTHSFVSETSSAESASRRRASGPSPSSAAGSFAQDIPLLAFDAAAGPYVARPPLAIDSARFFYGRGATGTLAPLRMHHRPRVIEKLLDQRWLRLRDVVLIAARRPTVPVLSWAVATRDRWFFQAPVREALAQIPFSPTSLVLALLPTISTSTVQRLVRAGAPEVRGAARLFFGEA